jgi:hypothetical protein
MRNPPCVAKNANVFYYRLLLFFITKFLVIVVVVGTASWNTL